MDSKGKEVDYSDKYTDWLTLEPESTHGAVICGTPYCPFCYTRLISNSMPDVYLSNGEWKLEEHWRCPNCGWWNTEELIKIAMQDDKEETNGHTEGTWL